MSKSGDGAEGDVARASSVDFNGFLPLAEPLSDDGSSVSGTGIGDISGIGGSLRG
jgi:hypothetical protein